jgi:hypothetical protein
MSAVEAEPNFETIVNCLQEEFAVDYRNPDTREILSIIWQKNATQQSYDSMFHRLTEPLKDEIDVRYIGQNALAGSNYAEVVAQKLLSPRSHIKSSALAQIYRNMARLYGITIEDVQEVIECLMAEEALSGIEEYAQEEAYLSLIDFDSEVDTNSESEQG